MKNSTWMDLHYPRCVRCGLRTYVSNLSGLRCSEVGASPSCAAYDEPEEQRPTWPYSGSRHAV